MPVQNKTISRTTDVKTLLLQYTREHDAVSYKRTEYAVKALLPFFNGKHVSELNIQQCRAYGIFREMQNVSYSTIARELTTLRAAMNHGVKWGRIGKHDLPVLEIPKNLPKRDVWLFKDEVKTLLDECQSMSLYAFTRLCYETASRKKAIEQLEWSQVDFGRGTINLSKPGERVTRKRRPTVPIGHLHKLLCDLYENRENNYVLGSNKNMSYEFEKLCERCDLLYTRQRDGRPGEKKVTPHVLRHSRATHLLEDGVSIYAVAKLLGDKPTTVERTYGHISMSSLDDELKKSSFI